jgi:uncharacterized damage-inducible protein DinB
MSQKEELLREFDQEMAGLRKTLERVPNDKWGWKPHPKSAAMGGLAQHLSQIPHWIVNAITLSELDIMPGGKPARQEPLPNIAAVLEQFEHNVKEARAALEALDLKQLEQPWTLIGNGKKFFTKSKAEILRTFALSHIVHHRAQLGVYLRLNDIPVPSIYGPSADEGAM